MKLAQKYSLISAWVIVATLALAFFWGNYPYLFFYLPESLSIWLIEIYGASNGEELADLELLYVFISSFLIVSFLTYVALALNRKLTRRVKRTGLLRRLFGYGEKK